jgi:SET domain-containing protein
VVSAGHFILLIKKINNVFRIQMTQRHYAPRTTGDVCTIDHGLEVKTSTIAGAGMGLFSTEEFKRNSYITFYDGEAITRSQALERRRRGKDTHIRSVGLMGDCIDGYTGATIRAGCGGASIANDGQLPDRNNCRLENKNGIAWLRANRDISSGEELLCSYGKLYWHSK